jgi:hypothetical protein
MDEFFKQADGLKYIMEQRWIGKTLCDQFPQSKEKLISNYKYIENYLNDRYHCYVGLGASIAGDGVLTDHGVKHVQAVINKAWNLIKDKTDRFNGYELYLLLLATHFHDLGNIKGREEHEQKIIEVMDEIGNHLPLDDAEKEFVSKISMAHGGYVQNNKNDKNTLQTLEHETTCNGITIRPMLLAAILRFADELADDYDRIIPSVKIPPENEVFQEYSKSLEPIGFDKKTLIFRFRIPYEATKTTLKKIKGDIFLYDEILERLSKCLRELDYCRRYSNGFIDIETIHVEIKVTNPKNSCKVLKRTFFKLSLARYPKEDTFHLKDFIMSDNSNISQKNLEFSNGEELKKAMLELEKGDSLDV